MSKRQFNIAGMRKRAGMKQEEVAIALEMKTNTYGDWERETTILNLKDAIRLADLFGCTLDELANHKVPNRQSVAPDEQTLLDGYRAADTRVKRHMLSTARLEIEMAEEDAREKRVI